MGRSPRTRVSAVVAPGFLAAPVSSEQPWPIARPIPRLRRGACGVALFAGAIGAAVAALALTLVLDIGPAITRGQSSDGFGPPSRTSESSDAHAERGGGVA
jgi:hypothetical protein